MNEEDRMSYIARQKELKDQAAAMHYATHEGREEGRKLGLEEGRAEGRAEGLEEGFAKGEAIGANNEKLAIAKKMKDLGIAKEQISLVTGLTEKQIEGI